jgi:hypothetical protein
MRLSLAGAAIAMNTLERSKNAAPVAASEGIKEEERMLVFVFDIVSCTWLFAEF